MNEEVGSDSKVAILGWGALPRGLAFFLGAFSLVNVLGGLWSPGFDANLWWIDLRFLSPAVAQALLVLSGVCLLAFGLRAPCSVWRRWMTVGCVGCLGIGAAINTVQFYLLLGRGTVHAGIPVPLSLAGRQPFLPLAPDQAELSAHRLGGLHGSGPRKLFTAPDALQSAAGGGGALGLLPAV